MTSFECFEVHGGSHIVVEDVRVHLGDFPPVIHRIVSDCRVVWWSLKVSDTGPPEQRAIVSREQKGLPKIDLGGFQGWFYHQARVDV